MEATVVDLPVTNVKYPRDFVQQYNKFFWKTFLAEMHKSPVPIVIVKRAEILLERTHLRK